MRGSCIIGMIPGPAPPALITGPVPASATAGAPGFVTGTPVGTFTGATSSRVAIGAPRCGLPFPPACTFTAPPPGSCE